MKYLIIAVGLLLSGATPMVCSEFFDTKGTEFFLTFIPNDHNNDEGVDSISLFIAADKPTTGFIEYRDKNSKVYTHNYTITDISKIHVFTLEYSNYELSGDSQDETVAPQYFRVVSNSDITVYGLTTATTSSDAFLVLPSDVLNNHYFIMSYGSWDSNPSQFAVTAVEDGTTVTIRPTAATEKNSTKVQSITLNKGESFLVQAASGDLTGTEITSDKPVAVFSGHERAAIPSTLTSASRDCLVEQLPPVTTWGENAFIVPFTAINDDENTLYKDIYRVLAACDNTKVVVNGTETITLNKGKYFEKSITGAVSLVADQPVMTAQFKKTSSTSNQSETHGDPLMLMIPPKEQFMDKYRVVNIQAYEYNNKSIVESFEEHYIAVVAPASAYSTITLDGSSVPSSGFNAISGSEYYYSNIKVSAGVHYMECSAPFGIFVYGYGERNSYGYVGGMAMKPFDSDPPEILVNSECYEAEGIVADTGGHNTGLQSVLIPPDSSVNVTTEINVVNSGYYTYKATLVNQYYDGHFSVVAVDSSKLTTGISVDIPGFTVWIKGSDPNGTAPVYSFEAMANKEFCFNIILNNYGKFNQEINDIYFKNKLFTIKSEKFGAIESGQEKTLISCITPTSIGVFTDTLVMVHDCGSRDVAVITLDTRLDYYPPVIAGTVLCYSAEGSVTDTSEYDYGLLSVTADADSTENTTVEINKTDAFNYTFRAELIDSNYDGRFTIIAADSAGLKSKRTFNIPGFTVWLKGFDPDEPAPAWNYRTRKGQELCFDIIFNNYGKYDHTISGIYLKNKIFTITDGEFTTIAEGGEKTVTACITPDTAGIFTDTLVITHDCGLREVAFITVEVPADRHPPQIAITPDPCKTKFTITITDSLSDDYGLKSIIYNELTNCSASETSVASQSWTIILTVTDPLFDAVWDVTVTDEYGLTTNIRDTVQGFTLSINSGLPDGALDFGAAIIGSRICDTIILYNYGLLPMVFDDILMAGNLWFSIPQSQLPLTIGPGEIQPLAVCFYPLQASDATLKDTLKLEFNCVSKTVPISGEADPLIFEGKNKCKVPLRIITTEVPHGYVLGQNVPNPVTGNITSIIFGIDEENYINLDVYSSDGKKICTLAEDWFKAGCYQVEFDTGNLPDGVYFYVLRSTGHQLTGKFVIYR